MSKENEIISKQAELIRTLTTNNLKRMSEDFWGGELTPPEEVISSIHLPEQELKVDTAPETQVNQEDVLPKESIEDLEAELNTYIGLSSVKLEVKSLIHMVQVAKMRETHGLPNRTMSLHMVFSGNPGTGKTMMARLMARIYHSLDILSKGQLVEVDRGGLVAGYVGQTALKTTEILEKAKGGVLFIDEAYALSNKGENDFGNEAIDTILKYMEDHRDDLVVICAGYDGLMQEFIHSNPGLESRFNRFLKFEDYSIEEMLKIFDMQCKKDGYILQESALEPLKAYLLIEAADQIRFGNARGVRNLLERIIVCQNNRLVAQETVTKEDLQTLTKEDVLSARYGEGKIPEDVR